MVARMQSSKKSIHKEAGVIAESDPSPGRDGGHAVVLEAGAKQPHLIADLSAIFTRRKHARASLDLALVRFGNPS